MPFHSGWLDDPCSSSLPACLLGQFSVPVAIEHLDQSHYPMILRVGKASLAADFAVRVVLVLPVPIGDS